MPSRKKRARRRNRGFDILPALIAVFALIAAILILLLIRSDPLSDENRESTPAVYADEPDFIAQADVTAAPLVVGSQDPAAQTVPEETVSPVPEETPQPVIDVPLAEEELPQEENNRFFPETAPDEGFMPILDRANRAPDDEMMIALTVDACHKSDLMAQYVKTASFYDAKLTLFPTGDALADKKMTASFVSCVKDKGYEIENYPYNKRPEYNLSSGELALQLWKQNITLSYILGRDYEQHFFRPVNIESAGDQRTHYLLSQMGFYGVASYTYSYNAMDVEALKKTLRNGNVYRFDMTEKSLNVFKEFIEYACSKGYQCVTMNRLFGLNEKVVSDKLTLDQQTLPVMDGYQPTYYELRVNSRSYAVLSLQTRLSELGYLTPEIGDDTYVPDGLYGPKTSRAVSAFQAKAGIAATGNADSATQQALFAADAPAAG